MQPANLPDEFLPRRDHACVRPPITRRQAKALRLHRNNVGLRRRSRTIPGHPQSPYGLRRTPRNRVSSRWTCILSFRTFSTSNVPNALSNEIPGRGTLSNGGTFRLTTTDFFSLPSGSNCRLWWQRRKVCTLVRAAEFPIFSLVKRSDPNPDVPITASGARRRASRRIFPR